MSTHMMTPSVRALALRMHDGSAVDHKPGQYLDTIVPTPRGLHFRRSYSIASAPDPSTPDRFQLAVTRVEGGPTSNALHTIEPGALIEIEGPEGTFVRRPEDRDHPTLFVATGTGLAPIRAMLTEGAVGGRAPALGTVVPAFQTARDSVACATGMGGARWLRPASCARSCRIAPRSARLRLRGECHG